jgi:hypothetical protein
VGGELAGHADDAAAGVVVERDAAGGVLDGGELAAAVQGGGVLAAVVGVADLAGELAGGVQRALGEQRPMRSYVQARGRRWRRGAR